MATAIMRAGCTAPSSRHRKHCECTGFAGRRMRRPRRRFGPFAYGESMEWRGATLTAYPASHIVGAAQLLIEFRGERIVYTGDIKLREPICGVPHRVVAL